MAMRFAWRGLAFVRLRTAHPSPLPEGEGDCDLRLNRGRYLHRTLADTRAVTTFQDCAGSAATDGVAVLRVRRESNCLGATAYIDHCARAAAGNLRAGAAAPGRWSGAACRGADCPRRRHGHTDRWRWRIDDRLECLCAIGRVPQSDGDDESRYGVCRGVHRRPTDQADRQPGAIIVDDPVQGSDR